jgi:hypothetical protein
MGRAPRHAHQYELRLKLPRDGHHHVLEGAGVLGVGVAGGTEGHVDREAGALAEPDVVGRAGARVEA